MKVLHWLTSCIRRAVRGRRPIPDVSLAIERALHPVGPVFFVQIGSNDGRSGDPLHPLIIENNDWTGIFVEPVRPLFERLKANYRESSRFVFENVAIGLREEARSFYYVSDRASAVFGDSLPLWHDQLGSFDRNHIVKHLDGLLEPYIVEETLHCIPLQALFDKHNETRIDLLHIDVEGFDYQVLAQLNFAVYRPQVILYEHLHLSDEERQEARALLLANSYRLSTYGSDCLAVEARNLPAARTKASWP